MLYSSVVIYNKSLHLLMTVYGFVDRVQLVLLGRLTAIARYGLLLLME